MNVLLQFFFMDYFLACQFRSYGPAFVKGTGPNIFPEWAYCRFPNLSEKGEYVNVQCYLHLNNINIWIYGILWLWLIILAAITVFLLIVTLTAFLFPGFWLSILRLVAPKAKKENLKYVT